MVLLITLLCAFLGPEPTDPTIDTVAGTGKAGYSGDGGPATKAQLNQPFHCALDGKGNLYVAEAFNHCIRKVNLKTGIISTVAGTGKKGYTGDGGPATKATFNEPYAIAIDKEQNLYVVDRLNAVIRKVDGKTGIITTIAGNGKKGDGGDGEPATKAMLREPNDCHLDGKGGLLIADVQGWRIRRVDLKTGIISTFAGVGRRPGKITKAMRGDGGSAKKAIIHEARAVCVDGKGNTYVCERRGSTIRRIDAKGIITTIAGTGQRGAKDDDGAKATFNAPKGVRCDEGGNIFVVDTENHSIRRIDAKTFEVTTVVGGQKGTGGDGGPALKAGMDRPHGCIIDAEGTIYVADSNNHRVRATKFRNSNDN